jgi:hypothetical protein
MLHGANFGKMLVQVHPESCAQAFKGSSSVNHAPPIAQGKASMQGPGALAGLKVIDLTRVLGALLHDGAVDPLPTQQRRPIPPLF